MQQILDKQKESNGEKSEEKDESVSNDAAILKSLDFIGFTNEYMSSQLDDVVKSLDFIGVANEYMSNQLGDVVKSLDFIGVANEYISNQLADFFGKEEDTKPAGEEMTEADNENIKRQEQIINLLGAIAGNTKGIGKGKETKTDDSAAGGMGLGIILTALAATLGGIVGAIKGYLKGLRALAEAIMPEKLIATIKNSFAKVAEFFTKVGDFVMEQFSKIKKLFSFGGESKIGKFITSIVEGISTAVTKFFEPIKAGWEMIKSGSKVVGEGVGFVQKMIGGIMEFFGTIGSKLASFGSIFKGAMGIMEKLAWPLTLIMAAWDGVKGFIEGFKEGGILGGIKGAIKGIIESIITAPLDLLKNLLSWIMEKLGFDKAAKWLDSFNFTDIMKNFVDMIFKPFDMIKKMFTDAVSWLQGITIPEIGFTIPIINKKISIGPFQPFGGKKETPAAGGAPAPATGPTSGGSAPAPAAAPPKAAPPPAAKTTAPTAAAPKAAPAPAPAAATTTAAPKKVEAPATSTTPKAAAPAAAASTAPKAAPAGDDWSIGTGGQKMNDETKAKILKMNDADAKKAIGAWKVLTDPKASLTARYGAGKLMNELATKDPSKEQTPDLKPTAPETGDKIVAANAEADSAKAAASQPAAPSQSTSTAVVNNNQKTTTILPKPPVRNPDPSGSTYYGMGYVKGHLY